MPSNILVIGAAGQIGTELTLKLREVYGADRVIATDITDSPPEALLAGPLEKLNLLDKEKLFEVVKQKNVSETDIWAALLSATAEQNT